MKNKFDSSQMNDGNSRITVPQSVKKGGGKFTWGKSVVFIIILALVVFYSVLVYRNLEEDKITEKQWIAMLSETFGINNVEGLLKEGTDDIATGRFAAVTVMQVVGRGNLTYLSDKEVLTDADLITLASDYNVVDGRLMNKNLTEKDVLEIIELAEKFYYDPDYYPEYCEVTYKEDVVDSTSVELVSYDKESATAIIAYEADEIVDGTIMILKTEFGICKAYEVSSAVRQADGTFFVALNSVSELSDVVECIYFSGTVDFSSAFFDAGSNIPEGDEDGVDANPGEDAEVRALQEYEAQYAVMPAGYAQSPFLLTAGVNPVVFEPMLLLIYSKNPFTKEYWSDEAKAERQAEKEAKKAAKEAEKKAKEEEKAAKKEAKEDKRAIKENFLKTVDLEMGGMIRVKAESDGTNSFSHSQYAMYSAIDENGDESSAAYEVSVDNKGKISMSFAKNNFELGLEVDEALKEIESDDSVGFSGSAESSLAFRVKVSNLAIIGSTYFQITDWDDEKNYVDFRVSGDVEVEGKIQGRLEGKFPLFEEEFPIPVTGGTVAVNLRFYLVVTLTGEIYVTYEIDNVHASVYVSQKGVDIDAGVDGTDFDMNAKVKLEVGPDIELALSVLGFDVLDPSVEARAVASAETLPKNMGFEAYDKCVQSLVSAPTLKLIFIGEDNIFNKILKQFELSIQPSYTFLDEEGAPFQKDLHIETGLDGKIHVLAGKADDVCTHVMVEEDDEAFNLQKEVNKKKQDIKEKLQDEVDKKKEEVEDELEDALEEWLSTNCGDCF